MLAELTSIQLIKILTRDEYTRNIFRGVFSRDEVPRKIKYPSCFIINTDIKRKPGEHWLAFFYDENGLCEFFDSFGFHPKIFRLESFLNRTSRGWSYNKKQIQSILTKSCGYFCFLYLLFRCRGIKLNDMDLNEKNLKLVFK